MYILADGVSSCNKEEIGIGKMYQFPTIVCSGKLGPGGTERSGSAMVLTDRNGGWL